MMPNTNNHTFRNDSDYYPSSATSSILEECLFSLLQQTSSSTPITYSSSLTACNHPSLNFEDPFDDPEMEPLPLRTPSSAPDHAQICSKSIATRHDSLVSPLLSEVGKPKRNAGHRQLHVVDAPNPAIGIFGAKRKSEDTCCISPKNGPHNIKRQRTNPATTHTNPDERKTRFRPSQEKLWREQFHKLIQFKFKNGHCRVPHYFSEDQVLSRWVKRQRYQYKKFKDNNPSTMTVGRIKELESIGFIWNSHTEAWQGKFEELKRFKEREGHCNVPSDFPENEELSTWVKCQRRQYKRRVSSRPSNLSEERYKALKSLDFTFDPLAEKR